MLWKISVPPTRDQGSYEITIRPPKNETVNQYALWHYNSARAHDGLPPLRRMPNGTRYTRVMEYVVQTWTGRQYGWEDECSEDTREEGRARLKEYRDNQPEYAHRMITRQVE